VLVGGLPERPLENLTFRNIVMRMTGFEPVEKQKKPRGVAHIRPATPETDYSTVPAAMIFANVSGLKLSDVSVVWDTAKAPQDRHAIYAGHVTDLSIEGFGGSPSGSSLAAIGLEKVKGAFISGARPDAGTAVFVGASGVPDDEIVLTGNNLKRGTAPLQKSAVHVHLP
jgi:hypothetical protein